MGSTKGNYCSGRQDRAGEDAGPIQEGIRSKDATREGRVEGRRLGLAGYPGREEN